MISKGYKKAETKQKLSHQIIYIRSRNVKALTTGWDTQNVKSWEWKHNCSLENCPKYEGHLQGIEANTEPFSMVELS